MYNLISEINYIAGKISDTLSLLTLGIGSVHYSLGEWFYDVKDMWS